MPSEAVGQGQPVEPLGMNRHAVPDREQHVFLRSDQFLLINCSLQSPSSWVYPNNLFPTEVFNLDMKAVLVWFSAIIDILIMELGCENSSSLYPCPLQGNFVDPCIRRCGAYFLISLNSIGLMSCFGQIM